MRERLKNQHHRFLYALRGICSAYTNHLNARLQIWSIFFFAGFAYFAWPLSETELLFLSLSYALILLTELQNTALERALDRLHPERHDDIGAAKDIAAGAVLIAGLFALVVVLVITTTRL